MNTKLTACAMLGAAALIAASIDHARALEPGFGGEQLAGATLGAAAEAPPPGLYMINQAFTANANYFGPGSQPIPGNTERVTAHVNVGVAGLLFSPGWTFLGATYTAVVVQPFVSASAGLPDAFSSTLGLHNTFINPVQLTWKLGDFGITTDLGIYVPDGSIQGPTGLGCIFCGNPWWTFQPEVRIGYYKDGWAFTADTFVEINTANTITQYTSGDILHEEITITKTFGKWTVGPVAYYAGQVTNDKNPNNAYGGFLGNKWNTLSVGGLLNYNFGPASLTVWAADTVWANYSGPNPAGFSDINPAKGWTAFATLSFQIWSPQSAPPKLSSLITK